MKYLLLLTTLLLFITSCNNDPDPGISNPFVGSWVAGLDKYPYDSLVFGESSVIFYGDNSRAASYTYDIENIYVYETTIKYDLDFDGLLIDEDGDNFGWMIYYRN